MPKKQPIVDIKIQQMVRDALVEICKIETEKIMEELVDKHPEWEKGTFTNSNRGSNQFQVRANMKFGFENNEEADALENGAKATPFTGTYVQNVRQHKRELGKSKGRVQKIVRRVTRKRPQTTTVKKHARTYKGMKPVLLSSGEWRILKGTPAQKKKSPLHTGITKLLKNESFLASRLKQFIS